MPKTQIKNSENIEYVSSCYLEAFSDAEFLKMLTFGVKFKFIS